MAEGRELKVQVGALRRLSKELTIYLREKEELEDSARERRHEGEFEAKRLDNLLEEHEGAMRQTSVRLNSTVGKVETLLASFEGDEELSREAREVLEQARRLCS
jgi:hypothetical protein